MSKVISVEGLSKAYQLGQIGTGTFAHDLNVWWAKKRGLSNPLSKIGQIDYGNREGEDLWALKNISFSVEQGEILGIIGRNGAGKSTLLKILSKVTAPTLGKIKIKGRIASLLEVGTGFHPDLTGRENVYLNGAILGMGRSEIDRKFDEIIDFAEIEKFIDTPVKRYSSGMYVRLAFAVAAHLESDILVVDEVLAVGDAEFQKKCLGKIGSVARGGKTVLFVSHNMGSLSSLCTWGILLRSGQIEMNDSIQNVIQSYINDHENFEQCQNPINISNFIRKQGSKEVRINFIGIKNNKNKFSLEFNIGEPFIIEFDIENPNITSRMISCWFSLSTQNETILGSSIQYDDKEYEILGQKKAKIIALLNDNIFSPGKYNLNVGILGRHKDIFEWVEKVITITILPIFWGNSKAFDNRIGTLALRSDWKVFQEE